MADTNEEHLKINVSMTTSMISMGITNKDKNNKLLLTINNLNKFLILQGDKS